MLSLLQPQQTLIQQASTIEKQIAVLLDYWQEFNHHFPSSFKVGFYLSFFIVVQYSIMERRPINSREFPPIYIFSIIIASSFI